MKNALALLLMRIGFGGMMLTHGWPKFQKTLDGNWSFGDPIGLGEPVSLALAVFAEFFCAILLILGFKTRWVAFPLAFTMLVAAFVVHADDPWKRQEFPLLYCTGFLALMLLGGGRYSLDQWLKQRK